MSERRAVVLAGGLGTRLQKVLPDVPKPLALVCGRPFIEWLLRFLAKEGVTQAVVSTGHKAPAIAGWSKTAKIKGLKIECVAETEPLGTAGGFLHAVQGQKAEGQPWLVCNGDSLALVSLTPLYAGLGQPMILGLRQPDVARYGRLEVASDGRLERFVEKGPSGPGVINAGVYLINTGAVVRFAKKRSLSFEADVFPGLVAAGRDVRVSVAEGPFLDIGTEETLAQAERFVLDHRAAF